MHFLLSLLSEYLNINEEISKKSPSVGQAFHSRGALEPEPAPACKKNSRALINILELGICEIELLISGVLTVYQRGFC